MSMMSPTMAMMMIMTMHIPGLIRIWPVMLWYANFISTVIEREIIITTAIVADIVHTWRNVSFLWNTELIWIWIIVSLTMCINHHLM